MPTSSPAGRSGRRSATASRRRRPLPDPLRSPGRDRHQVGSRFLLSGLLRCGACGKPYLGQGAKSGQYTYYVCSTLHHEGPGTCEARYLNAEKVEEFVVEKIRERILTDETITDLVTLLAEEIDTLAGELSSQLQAIEAELADVQSRLLRLYEALEKSTLTYEALSPRILSLRQREDQLAATREDAARQLTQRKVELPTSHEIKAYVADFRSFLEERTFLERKALIRNFVKGVEVAGDEATLSYTIPMPAGGVTSERRGCRRTPPWCVNCWPASVNAVWTSQARFWPGSGSRIEMKDSFSPESASGSSDRICTSNSWPSSTPPSVSRYGPMNPRQRWTRVVVTCIMFRRGLESAGSKSREITPGWLSSAKGRPTQFSMICRVVRGGPRWSGRVVRLEPLRERRRRGFEPTFGGGDHGGSRGAYIGGVSQNFTLAEARQVLAALRAMAPDGLTAPLSRADLGALLAAGIEVKSIEQGLIDFPTVIGDEPAYWCWQAGEQEIEWWHLRDAGFAGRRRVD